MAIVFTMFTVATFFVLAYHTVRQLRLVSQLHAEAKSINVLQPQPSYAFSRLTSRTAVGVLVFIYFDFLVNPPTPGVVLPYITFTAVAVLLMAAAFVLPLLGMHDRLTHEKARLEAEVNEAVELTYREMQRQVRSKSYGHVDELEKALSGLLRMRERRRQARPRGPGSRRRCAGCWPPSGCRSSSGWSSSVCRGSWDEKRVSGQGRWSWTCVIDETEPGGSMIR